MTVTVSSLEEEFDKVVGGRNMVIGPELKFKRNVAQIMKRLLRVRFRLHVPFILQYTICVSAQKIELEHQVCDKEVASRKLASEIAHLNKKKAMDETVWTVERWCH